MSSRGTVEFWRLYWTLPLQIRTAARNAYKKFLQNPAHPSLHLERLRTDRRFWSVRVTLEYRAVAFRSEGLWVWTWIGTHEEFDRQFPG
ncbi:MAG: hypothetical protein JWM99_3146 [Verrucomicrobiales bacterium]|nr:hypothetical protein [Verrucomicrobiales bacterium]